MIDVPDRVGNFISRKQLTVRARLTIWNCGFLTAALIALGLVLHWIARAVVLESVDRELASRARVVRDYWVAHQSDGGIAPTPRIIEKSRMVISECSITRGENAMSFAVTQPLRQQGSGSSPINGSMERLFTPDGAPKWGKSKAGPWDAATLARSAVGSAEYSTVLLEKEPYRVYSAPVRRLNQVVGVIQVATPMADVERGLAGLTSALLIVSPIALLVSGVGGAYLTGRTLRPICRISRTAERIGAGNLSERLPADGGDEIAQLSQTMNGMLARLEQSFVLLERSCERQRRFTADVSHELRTPLSVILGNASLALSVPSNPRGDRRALEACNTAAVQMSHMVHDLLLLARADSGQLDLQLCPIPIANVLETAAELFKCREHPRIMLEINPPGLQMLGDHWSLVRLFTNLIENAARHTPQTGSITLRAASVEGNAVVTVEDTGAGIPPEHLPHVFERFYRANGARSRNDGGSGLGLSICQSIAEAHGGHIAIDSTPGAGTTVSVTLPQPRIDDNSGA